MRERRRQFMGGPARRRRMPWRAVVTPLLVLLVLPWHPAGSTRVAAPPVRPAAVVPAAATIDDEWWTNEDTLGLSLGMSPTLTGEVFDRPGSFAWAGTVPEGWTTTPYVNYGSYAAFASDISAGEGPESAWVMYDPELWYRGPSELQRGASPTDTRRLRTPGDEQLHPVKYMKMFARLAHNNGYWVINAPGVSLLTVPGGDCTQRTGEALWDAYIRCGIARAAATGADEIDVQAQQFECTSSTYASYVARAAAQARAAEPQVKVLSGLSTGWCSPTSTDLFDAWNAVAGTTDGHFMVIGTDNAQPGINFLARVAPIIVGDDGVDPPDEVTDQGTCAAWRVSWAALKQHSITDATGMGLFDSGLQPAGYTLRHTYLGAGAYDVKDTATGQRGTVTIPLVVSAGSGSIASTFTITSAAGSAPSGFVFQTQILRPGSGSWTLWKTGPTNAFKPDAGVGTYSFRARMSKKTNGAAAAWSPEAAIVIS